MIATPPPDLDWRFLKTISKPLGKRLESVILSFFSQVSVINIKSAFCSTIKSFISTYLLLQDLAFKYKHFKEVELSMIIFLQSKAYSMKKI